MLAWALRHRRPLLAVAGALFGAVVAVPPIGNGDPQLFAAGGDTLLSGRWLHALDDPTLQVGPLHLLFAGVAGMIARAVSLDRQMGISAAIGAAGGLGTGLVAGRMRDAGRRWRPHGRSERPAVELFAGTIAIFGGPVWVAAFSGHSSELFIPLLWLMAAVAARRERTFVAALLLAAAGGCKLWGSLGAPILLLDRNAIRVGMALALQAALTAALYLPFFLWGDAGTLSFEWQVARNSAVGLLTDRASFSWAARAIEGAIIVGIGTIVALMARRSPEAVWAVPLALAAARFLPDPLAYYYYWLPVGTIGVIALVRAMPPRPSWLAGAAMAVFYATLLPFFFLHGTANALWIIAAGAGSIAIAVAAARRTRAGL